MEHVDQLHQVVMLLAAAVLMVAFFRYLRLSPVLGYLVAGVAIGPHGIALVSEENVPVHLAEFGVIFLLFTIGLELTFSRLVRMRTYVFGFGLLQVILTAVVIASICHYFDFTWPQAVIVGGGLALSSTAVVLQVMNETGQQSSQVGRLSLATLLMQDFIVVPLLVLIPLLQGDASTMTSEIWWALGKAILAMAVIIILGRLLIRPLFRIIWSTTNEELFVATTLLIALGSALATQAMGLSLALGAFMAGLLIAETEYRSQVEADIMPFKGLFLGLFFMTVGMTVDWQYIYTHLDLIGGLVAALLSVKAILIFMICMLFRIPLGPSLHSALLLAQGGEFAFVLFGLASQGSDALIDPERAELLMITVTTSMALTPLLSAFGGWLAKRIAKRTQKEIRKQRPVDLNDLVRHVIVVGFGQAGKMVARVLTEEKMPFVVVDNDTNLIEEARKDGVPIYQGDATRRAILERLFLSRAQAVVITLHNDVAIQKVISAVRRKYPHIQVIARTKEWFEGLGEEQDKTILIPESYEMGLQLAGALLRTRGINENEISRMKNKFRHVNYQLTKVLFMKETMMPVLPDLFSDDELGDEDSDREPEESKS